MEDLPLPVLPIMAVTSPGFDVKLIFCSTGLSAPGKVKDTFSKQTVPFSFAGAELAGSGMEQVVSSTSLIRWAASVIEAMKAGDYYASTGPELEALYIRDGRLHVRCSPVEKIYVITRGRRCLMELAPAGEDSLTEAVFALQGDEGYIRVDCRDSHGRHAYSNAYFIGD